MEIHRFYCINCGHEGIPIARSRGHRRNKYHRKVLYCPFCKQKVNHVECKNEDEVDDFLTAFNFGAYKEEAAKSIEYLKEKGVY